jgi:DNA-binding CsgD family transcriptional regulator
MLDRAKERQLGISGDSRTQANQAGNQEAERRAGNPSKPFPGHDTLTPRKRNALAQITRGASSKEAARTLGISPRTVDFHRANPLKKLGAWNAADLVHKVLGE